MSVRPRVGMPESVRRAIRERLARQAQQYRQQGVPPEQDQWFMDCLCLLQEVEGLTDEVERLKKGTAFLRQALRGCFQVASDLEARLSSQGES